MRNIRNHCDSKTRFRRA